MKKSYRLSFIIIILILISGIFYQYNFPVFEREIEVPLGMLKKWTIKDYGIVFNSITFPHNVILEIQSERVLITNCNLSIDNGWNKELITLNNVTNSYVKNCTLIGGSVKIINK